MQDQHGKRDRRDFLKGSATLSLGFGLGACGASPQSGATGAGPNGAGAGGAAGEAGTAGMGGASGEAGTGTAGTSPVAGTGGESGSAGAAGSGGSLPATPCDVTAPNIKGPFHTPGSPERSVLWDDDPTGERLIVRGRVRGVDCSVVPGATLDFWEANKTEGLYDNEGFLLRGHQVADAEGGYELRAIVPGRYLNGAEYRPQHIHVIVSAPGYVPITTQLYFEGDPYNETDAFIVDSLIMDPKPNDEGVLEAEFDFVLEPAP